MDQVLRNYYSEIFQAEVEDLKRQKEDLEVEVEDLKRRHENLEVEACTKLTQQSGEVAELQYLLAVERARNKNLEALVSMV
jgi:hypothetical protein